jgi:hypothetical protein
MENGTIRSGGVKPGFSGELSPAGSAPGVFSAPGLFV